MFPWDAVNQLSLDQLVLFVAIAESGSFSAAARRLGRVQSTVSHGIAQLESALGVCLFDRSRHKPQLTPAGQALLLRAREVLTQVRHLQAEAERLQSGQEAFVSLVLDMIIPVQLVTQSLQKLQRRYPDVKWLVHTEMLSAITQRVLEGSCQLGLTGMLLPRQRQQLQTEKLGQIDFVYVVAADHPLSALSGSVAAAELAAYPRLAVADRGIELPELAAGQHWQLADLNTLLAFAEAGFGWAFLPLHLVWPGLQAGRLRLLQLAAVPQLCTAFPIYSIRLRSELPGPVRQALLQAFTLGFQAYARQQPSSEELRALL